MVLLGGSAALGFLTRGSDLPPPFPTDPSQLLERTCFQTGQAWSERGNLRADVAIVYGVDPRLPGRIGTWRERGYRIHVMTGVSWGQYQDYLYGRFDGEHHEDEAQTDARGNKISHGGDVYYMSPGKDFGAFLAVGVQRALDAGAEAIHLEEPEFWVRGGYSEGFKREWRDYYHEDWQPPQASVDSQWRASKLKYFLYRRALQQVFDHVQTYNRRTGRHVRCFVPTHSLLNYAHWRIVSPESSLARLQGCDGYIAQVWTGTSRTPNQYRGAIRERTFETAFLEYGAMQNLVRATGRTIWYLNDPIEDNPRHDWADYRGNWESTLVASLLQPEVWQFEVAPWPERVFGGRYPRNSAERKPIPPEYATELQTVFHALEDMRQPSWEWDCGTRGLGVVVSDSLMFERGEPAPGDPHLGEIYGIALPLLKHGLPVAPVQLENVALPGYLDDFRLLLLTYRGMKPLDPGVHPPLVNWVRDGGTLLAWDDDGDPYNKVREWWNSNGLHYATPREALFDSFGLTPVQRTNLEAGVRIDVGKGALQWLRADPAQLAADPNGAERVRQTVRAAIEARGLPWKETDHLLLRRGPYVIAAGLDESMEVEASRIEGRFIDLFSAALPVVHSVTLTRGSRHLLLDLDRIPKDGPRILASACKVRVEETGNDSMKIAIEGVGETPAIVLLRLPRKPGAVELAGQSADWEVDPADPALVRIRFPNEARPRELVLRF